MSDPSATQPSRAAWRPLRLGVVVRALRCGFCWWSDPQAGPILRSPRGQFFRYRRTDTAFLFRRDEALETRIDRQLA